jgi:hypothetical protein
MEECHHNCNGNQYRETNPANRTTLRSNSGVSVDWWFKSLHGVPMALARETMSRARRIQERLQLLEKS